MEQSATPAARVGDETPTFSMSTQYACIWLLIVAAPSDSFFALCINWLTYLLKGYFIMWLNNSEIYGSMFIDLCRFGWIIEAVSLISLAYW